MLVEGGEEGRQEKSGQEKVEIPQYKLVSKSVLRSMVQNFPAWPTF
jgi:hypothetical protein